MRLLEGTDYISEERYDTYLPYFLQIYESTVQNALLKLSSPTILPEDYLRLATAYGNDIKLRGNNLAEAVIFKWGIHHLKTHTLVGQIDRDSLLFYKRPEEGSPGRLVRTTPDRTSDDSLFQSAPAMPSDWLYASNFSQELITPSHRNFSQLLNGLRLTILQ